MGCLLQVGGSNECGSLEQKDKAVPGMARITQEKLGVPKPRRPAAEIPYLVAGPAYSHSENSSVQLVLLHLSGLCRDSLTKNIHHKDDLAQGSLNI